MEVILMVAITVVLAAVVFVLVGNLTDTSDSAPQVVFTKSGSGNNTVLTVQSTSVATNWEDYSYSIAGSSTCVVDTVAGIAVVTNGTVPASGAVSAGHTIDFDGAGCAGATFNLVHIATNQISGRATL